MDILGCIEIIKQFQCSLEQFLCAHYLYIILISVCKHAHVTAYGILERYSQSEQFRAFLGSKVLPIQCTYPHYGKVEPIPRHFLIDGCNIYGESSHILILGRVSFRQQVLGLVDGFWTSPFYHMAAPYVWLLYPFTAIE